MPTVSSCRENPSSSVTESTLISEAPDVFRRKLISNTKCHWPRRYVMALLLFMLLLIQFWRKMNMSYTLLHVYQFPSDDIKERYPKIGIWTLKEMKNFHMVASVAEFLAQIPAALLMFKFSSHKLILATTIATSILHMLIQAALNHHSASLLILILGQSLLDAPVKVGLFSVWRDWAPPVERTRLITFSMFGGVIGKALSDLFPYLFIPSINHESCYLAGISGLIWALFWYNITSDTPQNDPLISENELLYLETNIHSDIQRSMKLIEVPWKSIITSKEILILCFIFFKTGYSIETILSAGLIFHIILGRDTYLYVRILFIIIVPGSVILADFLLKKFSGRTLIIRKSFLCGGFLLQCLFLFGLLSPSHVTKAVFYMISYTCFLAALPGFVTLPLDLSPRYVEIVAGFMCTFYVGGIFFAQLFIFVIVRSINSVFYTDGIFTFVSALLFAKWGDVEEQLWSLNFFSRSMSRNGRSYPNPDHQDDSNLAPENV